MQTDDTIHSAITADIQGQRLEIGARNGTALDPTHRIRYRLVVKDLNAFAISGSVDAQATGIPGSPMLTGSTSSEILASGVSAALTLRVKVSGSGAVNVSGKAHTQGVSVDEPRAHEASDGRNVPTNVTSATTFHADRSAYVAVGASDALMMEANGSNSVVCSGHPNVTLQTLATPASAGIDEG